MKTLGTFVITVALIVGLAGCAPGPVQYTLTISVTEGGEIVAPGEGTFIYDEGTPVTLVVFPHTGYHFVNWTGDVGTVADVNAASTIIIMNDAYSITANFAVKRYDLTTASTEGGSVATPGEGTHTYNEGAVINLVAQSDEDYQFTKWTGNVGTVADVNTASTTITMNGDYTIMASFAKEICDWYDLDTIRDTLGGSHVLMNNLDSTTAGYTELASPTANGGKGWEPIGGFFANQYISEIWTPVDPFTGNFNGEGYEIRDLFVNRPGKSLVGLFGEVDETGAVEGLSVVNAQVTGHDHVGGLMGYSWGTVSNSYSTGVVAGEWDVGGLIGCNDGTVSNSYSTSSVTGRGRVGGLVGRNNWDRTVSNSYSTGSVTGDQEIGGLVGHSDGTVSNSHYNYDEVLINGQNIITIGALFDEDFEQWLSSDKFLDVNRRLTQEDDYYVINDVGDFKELLAFGQDDSLKFRLKEDLDLSSNPGLYVPYLAGEFDGNGYKISNLNLNLDSIAQVGLFGSLARGGKVIEVRAENANITGCWDVGSLVGCNQGTVSNSCATGSVTYGSFVGGLVGWNAGIMSNSYSDGSATGDGTGGLVGKNTGTVSNSHYNYDEVLINGQNIITIGALFDEDFEQWLANDKFLDVNERLSQEDGYYLINNVDDFKQLLAFGQDRSLKFRLRNALDLRNEPNFYIPYLSGDFDGNGRKISNLSLDFDFVLEVGLFGLLAHGGRISKVAVENVDITGSIYVGGLVGHNCGGTVSNSYSTGSVAGGWGIVGGLVGESWGTVSNSYSTGSVTGWNRVGGLMGWNNGGTVDNSYSSSRAAGDYEVGGLVGFNLGIVSNSFWDIETSGQSASAGGTGKTMVEMNSITTFSGAGWNIIGVANSDVRNPSYIWNIVDGQTCPLLSWEP